jgi:hypothetical protein
VTLEIKARRVRRVSKVFKVSKASKVRKGTKEMPGQQVPLAARSFTETLSRLEV